MAEESSDEGSVIDVEALGRLRLLPAHRVPDPGTLREAARSGATVVVLDDDPTGTQTVAGVPVLTAWEDGDVAWALEHADVGFFVLTNTRSLGSAGAADRLAAVHAACERAAARLGRRLVYASRGDSTLRGHFPLETDVLAGLERAAGRAVDGVVLAPAYVDAGRITLHGVHLVDRGGSLVPVGETEYADDATFGYRESVLARWVEERSDGGIPATRVAGVGIETLREGDADAVARQVAGLDGGVLTLDAATDDDLAVAVLGLLHAEADGARLVYRCGPSFVRARLGQRARGPLTPAGLASIETAPADDRPAVRGLVVAGSHVSGTTRQLAALRAARRVETVELDVASRLDRAAVARLADRVVEALGEVEVIVQTSRERVTGAGAAASLELAREVSDALVELTARVVARVRPAFLVAKGGITASDVATRALGIRRAEVAGTLLPGIVSVWLPRGGPMDGTPYVVFAGNVGDDASLVAAVDVLSAAARLRDGGGRDDG